MTRRGVIIEQAVRETSAILRAAGVDDVTIVSGLGAALRAPYAPPDATQASYDALAYRVPAKDALRLGDVRGFAR
jgi:hypothetical protein